MMQIKPTTGAPVDLPAEPQAAPDDATAAHVDPWGAGGEAAGHDPFVALAMQAELHHDLKSFVPPQGAPVPGDPKTQGMQHLFGAPIVVMAPGPFVQRSAMPDKIGGAHPPVLEGGKSSGPIVSDLQGKLNMWRERQWHTLEGRRGWPTGGLDLKGNFDKATTQAVKDFQKAVGLPVTGVADAATQNLLKLECDPRYWLATTEPQRVQVRQLLGSIDAVRADAVVKLLDSSAFQSAYTDQTQVIAALVASRGDPALAASFGKLLDDIDFKYGDPDMRSAVLRYIAGHPDARTADALLGELRNKPGSTHTLLPQAIREWNQHVAGQQPAQEFGRNAGATPPLTSTDAIPKAAWAKPETIVGRLTQESAGLTGPNASVRCAGANLLAGALLRGKDAAAQLLDQVANNRKGQLTELEARVLHGIATRLRDGNVTFGDLSMAQDLLYKAGSTRVSANDWRSQFGSNPVPNLPAAKAARVDALLNKPTEPNAAELRELSQLISTSMGRKVTAVVVDEPLLGGKGIMLNYEPRSGAGHGGMFDGGLDDTEVQRLARAGGMSGNQVAYDHRSVSAIGGVLVRLAPGESAIIHLPTADGKPPQPANHFISVGVLADGRPYIYNPAPQKGDATLVVGRASDPQDPAFLKELERYTQRANTMDKSVVVNALKTSP